MSKQSVNAISSDEMNLLRRQYAELLTKQYRGEDVESELDTFINLLTEKQFDILYNEREKIYTEIASQEFLKRDKHPLSNVTDRVFACDPKQAVINELAKRAGIL